VPNSFPPLPLAPELLFLSENNRIDYGFPIQTFGNDMLLLQSGALHVASDQDGVADDQQ